MTCQKEFEAAATRALQHAVAWRSDGPKLPAVPTSSREELRALFDVGLPSQGLAAEAVIENLVKAAEPGLANNTHSNFYSWVQGSSHPVGVAADILTSAWGQNAAIYQTAPAAAVAEEVAGKWLLELLDLPASASLAFSTGATMASFICLAAARSEVLHRHGYDLEEHGLGGAPAIKVFVGEEAHATIFSDLRYLGFGRNNIIRIDADAQGRMLMSDLAKKMTQQSGPKIVIAQAGHINSGAFDPFLEIIPLAAQHKAWVHVDGAFGLWARSAPALAPHCAGVQAADSWTTDGHKWLQIPYDSGFAIIKDSVAHRRAMDISASYLVKHPGDGRNPSQFSPELSRRSRGFAVWAVLQALGRDGVVEMLSRHCQCARHLTNRLQEETGIRVLNEVVLNQLAIAFGEEDQALEIRDQMTARVIDIIRDENHNFVHGAHWKGQSILRISIISRLTDISDIDGLVESILRAWRQTKIEIK